MSVGLETRQKRKEHRKEHGEMQHLPTLPEYHALRPDDDGRRASFHRAGMTFYSLQRLWPQGVSALLSDRHLFLKQAALLIAIATAGGFGQSGRDPAGLMIQSL